MNEQENTIACIVFEIKDDIYESSRRKINSFCSSKEK